MKFKVIREFEVDVIDIKEALDCSKSSESKFLKKTIVEVIE